MKKHNEFTNSKAEKILADLIAEFNEEVEFPTNEKDLPLLKEVVEFTDEESKLFSDVSTDEVKKTEE